MNAHMRYFILDLIVNLIIVVLYIIWKLIAIFILRRKDASKGLLIRIFVMLICPLAGPFYFGVSYLVFRVFLHADVDLSDVVFGKDKVMNRQRADEERARGLAPMEETLAVSDRDSLRSMVMNVLHGDLKETLGAVAEGLESDDSETAHYAASILQSELSRFRGEVTKQEKRIEDAEDAERPFLQSHLLSYMLRFLEKQLLNALEHRSYVLKAEQLADAIWQTSPTALEGEQCEQLCLRLIEIREWALCETWCDRLAQLFPHMLGAYTARIKLYYSMGDSQRFRAALEALRSSDVLIDTETLNMIRAFM